MHAFGRQFRHCKDLNAMTDYRPRIRGLRHFAKKADNFAWADRDDKDIVCYDKFDSDMWSGGVGTWDWFVYSEIHSAPVCFRRDTMEVRCYSFVGLYSTHSTHITGRTHRHV